MVGTRNKMLLTILASDEPAGRIQFNVVRATHALNLCVQRIYKT